MLPNEQSVSRSIPISGHSVDKNVLGALTKVYNFFF